MMEGLEQLLELSQPGVAELGQTLQELLRPELRGKLLECKALQLPNPRAYRVLLECGGQKRSLIVKRLDPPIAQRNYLVLTRWLPAVGLGQIAPALLGVAGARNGQCVWHVYEDLGHFELKEQTASRAPVQAAVELIAQLHTRFAGHPLLPECRLSGGELGGCFFSANVRDAINALEALHKAELAGPAEHHALIEQLHTRLERLSHEAPARLQALDELGGPETLLHGDLWTTNAFVVPGPVGLQARLIDWDHAAVGPISYDLSTFLMRFPAEARAAILDLYRQAVAPAGWRLPPAPDLNYLFETAEYGRFANRIVWPVIALLRDGPEWAWNALAEVEQWFNDLEPVLPGVKPSVLTQAFQPASAHVVSAGQPACEPLPAGKPAMRQTGKPPLPATQPSHETAGNFSA
jgi:Phosphotransferase enzyme family